MSRYYSEVNANDDAVVMSKLEMLQRMLLLKMVGSSYIKLHQVTILDDQIKASPEVMGQFPLH